jgi:site-specific recombinase XerD
MRHTGATSIQRHGRDLRVTQRWLRHSSVATTEIYTEVAEDDMHEALGGLPPLSA